MKKALANLFGWGIITVLVLAAFLIFDIPFPDVTSRISDTYQKFRVYPELIEKKRIDGFEVEIVKTKSENLVLRALDWLLVENKNGLVSSTHTGCFNGKVKITIDLSLLAEAAERTAKDWESYRKNALLPADDPSWNLKKQVIYDILKRSNDLEKDYFTKKLKYEIDHELCHARDSTSDIFYTRGNKELRAFLSSLMDSPLALADLDDIERRSSEKSILAAVLKISGYTFASEKAFKGFLGYKDAGTKYQLSRLSANEISKRAKEIYDKEYKNRRYFENFEKCGK
ncbi:MAG: hypothetical protein Q7R35_10685 [Elusimicrobiota bacterium]|nr:hypothetical protein [Elusimicrobiota bacterium]